MKKKLLMCVLISVALMGALCAQASFFDDGGEVTSDSAETNFSSAETDTNGVMNSASMSKSEKILEWHGFAKLDARLWVHPDVKRADAIPVFGLTVSHSSPKTELAADLQLNVRTVKDYPLDILNELTMRAYLGDCVLSAGKLKLVWGKGDMIHVLDVFNANDLTDFTIPAYIDRRIGEPMVHFAYNAPIPLRLELAWAPSMTPDRIALSDPWVPPQLYRAKQSAHNHLLGAINDSTSAFSLFFDETKLQQALHDPISKILKENIPNSITIDMKDIVGKLNESALLEGITIGKKSIKKLLENLAKQKITIPTTEIIEKFLPPKPDGTPYTEAELKAALQGEPFLTQATAFIAKQIADTAKKAETEFIASLKTADAVIGSFRFDEFVKIGMNAFLPDMHNIKYGQYGIRLSGSAGPVDMAGQYYFGHYKTPSIDVDAMVANALAGKSLADCVHYDPVHIFGIDLGTAIAMFNLKSEFAYYMTGDFKGTDPAVHNNSIQWVMGFDVDIPLNNINVNIQNLGAWTLGFKKVKENNENGKFDMDWNTAEKSTNNKLIVNISDSWLHENLTDSLTCIWGIEHNDFVIIPKLRYRIKDELYVEGTGAYIYAANKKSEFSNWKNNHFVQASLEYRF
ncbi:hypothetical protein ABH09_03160 [Treponema sp. OMZ 803]|uniref:hypothetical protein n=1 Tax=Treponema sp. OMZ 803 TaxID=120682 RepID=UPI0020A3C34A|nr:hypothetical protein [Treponema sp. OMZ 803]UTC53675.1 hypothetical protein ABH09_03160 [Treponema sp. OMZ 803]